MERFKDYLRRILNVKLGDQEYVEMDTYSKEYNKFIKTLNYKKMDPAVENIFLYLHNNGITVSKIVKKQKGKIKLLEEMQILYHKQEEYYNNVLKARYIKEAQQNCHSWSDVDVEMRWRESVNKLFTDEDMNSAYLYDSFLRELDSEWDEFNNYLYKVIELVFSGLYSKERWHKLRIDEFIKVVEEEKNYYYEYLEEYNQSGKNRKDSYYDGKNDNPYKNLYIYYRNVFIKNYYIIDMPIITNNNFFELKYFDNVEIKEKYSLKDIAETYKYMSGSNDATKKIYNKIKVQFRGLEYIRKYKKDGVYVFRDMATPLANYVYYRKKNHKKPSFSQFSKCDKVIHCVYAPILRTMILGDKNKIKAYITFHDFISTEYNNIFSKVNEEYQRTSKSILMKCCMRIYFRCNNGFDVDTWCE